MRRVTWTFLSQHAQIVDYDGKRLLLGIATVGLVNTFRAGNHAELVRQALIDEIGVDVPVEGVPMPDAGSDRRAAAPARVTNGRHRRARPNPTPWPEPEADPWTQPGAPPDFVPPPRSGVPRRARRRRPPPVSEPATSRPHRARRGVDPSPAPSADRAAHRPPHRGRRRDAQRVDGSWRAGRTQRVRRPQRLSGRRGERRRREHRADVVRRSRRGRTGARRPVPRASSRTDLRIAVTSPPQEGENSPR